MIFNRLIVQKLIKYFNLDQLFEKRVELLYLHQEFPTKVEEEKPLLEFRESTEILVSALVSAIVVLLIFSVPFVALESPCEPLKEEGYLKLYNFAKTLEKYTYMMDRMIIMLSIILFIVSVVAFAEACTRADFDSYNFGKPRMPLIGIDGIPVPREKEEKKEKKKKIQEPYVWHFAHFKVNV